MSRAVAQKERALLDPLGLRPRILPAAVLIAITLVTYLPAMRGGFLWDDPILIAENPLVTDPGGLRKTWLTKEAVEYLPLTFTMLWAEWRLWNGQPAGFHVINVLLHTASAVLLWRVLRRLRVPGAWLAGVLFAVHPVAVASAAWISEDKNTLSMMLYLLSLLAYLRFDEREELARRSPLSPAALRRQSPGGGGSTRAGGEGGWRWYALAIFLFLLALLAKTSVVMLPVVLLLCAWWRRGRITRKDLLRSVPFFALSLALGFVTIWFQWRGWRAPGAEEVVRPEGIASRAAAAAWIAWFYLYKILFPVGLCAVYPRWKVDGTSVLAFLPLLLLLGGLAFLWARRKSWGRAPLFAAAYFLIALLPVLGFLHMAIKRHSLVADHLQYVAMIGVIPFAAGLWARAAAASGRARRAGFLAATGCVALLAVLTWDRASLYADEKLLWRDNIAKNPAAWAAWSSLGIACSGEGLYGEALRCFNRAIALQPDFAELYYNRGGVHAATNRFAEALKDYDKAIALNPGFAAAYNNRSNVYLLNGRYDEVIRDCDRAIELKPDYREAYNNRAVACYRMKEYDQALADMKTFQRLGGHPDPDFLKALSEAAGRRE